MSIYNSLYIPKELLIKASGIQKDVVDKDEASGIITFQDGFIWYNNAISYVTRKWSEGKTQMYPPISNDQEHSFPTRILSLLDDELASGRLKMEWKKR